MRKLLRIIAAAVLSVACMGSFASAASCDGNISGTGPGSNNTISCTDVNNVAVACTNNVWVGNVNNQNAVSGSGSVQFNTSTGDVLTGQAINSNGQNVTIGASCGTPAAPVTPAGGSGSVTPAEAVTPGKGSVTPAGSGYVALPYTASNSTMAIVLGSAAAAATILGVSRIGIAFYRKFSLK